MRAPTRLALAALLVLSALVGKAQITNGENRLRWVDAETLSMEGKGWVDTQKFYDRLPARAERTASEAVWNLSKDSAGICVRSPLY